MVSRNVVPVMDDTATAVGFLPRIQFYGEAQRGFGSNEDEWAWDVKIGGLLELYRWSGRSSLVALVGHELTANPFNSIGFNPRGAVWEESLFLLRRASALDWYVGAFHRCRHEIDNSHPPDESVPSPGYLPTARLLSLTGVQLGLALREMSLGNATTARMLIRLERYATTTDNRTPRNTTAPFWKRALGATGFATRVARTLGPSQQVYAQAWTSVMYFSPGPGRGGIDGRVHWRTEVGTRVQGAGGGLDLFTAYEHAFDDITRPTPQPSGVLGVGIRLSPR